MYQGVGAIFTPSTQIRNYGSAKKIISKKSAPASTKNYNPQKNKKKGDAGKKKKKPSTMYKQYDLKDMDQFSLCDAMRFVSKQPIFLKLLFTVLQIYQSL